MDKQIENRGIFSTPWGIIGSVIVVVVVLSLCALIWMMYSVDVGGTLL